MRSIHSCVHFRSTNGHTLYCKVKESFLFIPYVINVTILLFCVVRFNKLGLDKIATGEEPNPSNQVEEVHSYTPVQSDPLSSEKIVHIDIGTAHSAAVTGETFILVF